MSALVTWVERLEERVKAVEDSRTAYIPSERYVSASVHLDKLAAAYRDLALRYRFAKEVVGSDQAEAFKGLRENLHSLLKEDFAAFTAAHLPRGSSDLGTKVQPILNAIGPQVALINAEVDRFRKRVIAEFDGVMIQARLLKALGLDDYTTEVTNLQVQFVALIRRYGEKPWTSSTGMDWNEIQRSLALLKSKVDVNQGVGLSDQALQVVRRILGPASDAPSLLEISPSILVEIQRLKEFAGSIKITRS